MNDDEQILKNSSLLQTHKLKISEKYDKEIISKLKIYEKIAMMRQKMISPVDYAGCDQHEETDGETKNFCVLISLILSSRTKDEAVAKAMKNLSSKIDSTQKDT